MSLFKFFSKRNEPSAIPQIETVAPVEPSASEANVLKKTSVRYVIDKYGAPRAITVSEEN